MKKIILLPIFLIISSITFAQMKDDIKMFPKAEKEQNQKVIRLEPKEDENNYMVEIFIGKKTVTDACNNYFLIGQLEEKNLDGWGYNYYTFDTKGDVASTMKGCLNNASKEQLVYAQSQKVRYNSRLPIVIYTPKGYEVDYKIWSASEKIYHAE